MTNFRLKIAILEAGLTQRELARRVGLHESLVSLIARGRYNPDPLQEARIATALGRDVSELFWPRCRNDQ